MKKLIITITLILLITSAFSQSCLPEGITFETQAEIDSFQINYPECIEIEGDVIIRGWDSDIVDLSGLNVITSIGGILGIAGCDGLLNLNGLESLTNVGDSVILLDNDGLKSLQGFEGLDSVWGSFRIEHCDSLSNLNSLESLTYIGGSLTLMENYSLINIQGLGSLINIGENLTIINNDGLINLEGLGSLLNIGGSLTLFGNEGLINLEGLGSLLNIGGSLTLFGNEGLINLEGLEQLNSIGGDLYIHLNSNLLNLNSLENLQSIAGDLIISRNDTLVSLEGIDNIEPGSIVNLTISYNQILSTCEVQSICNYLGAPGGVIDIYWNANGCNSLSEIVNSCGISMPCLPFGNYYLNTQMDIDSFHVNYMDCFDLQGDVLIGFDWSSSYKNLNGLNPIRSVEGDLGILRSDSLNSLSGLDSLKTIGGTFTIGHYLLWGNQSLQTLDGLNNLEFIGGDCHIHNNPNLISLTGLENLDSITGSLEIGNLTAAGSSNYSLKNLDGLNPDVFIGSGLGLYGNDSLTTLLPFNNVNHLERLEISGNGSLQNLTGLEKLESISGNMDFSANHSIINLTGLDSLTSIGGSLTVGHNDSLTSLEGLNKLNTIGSGLSLFWNHSVTSIAELEGLTFIGGFVALNDNDMLTSLSGLDNIILNSTNELYIENNDQLSHCSVLSICNYLNNAVGPYSIENNMIGCNSPEEVQDSCEANAVYVDERYISDRLLLFPNPANRKLNISAEGLTIDEVIIYSLTGQQLYVTRPNSESIDISALNPGMYILEVFVENRKVRQKLLVQRE